ncbi:hypothetical protein AAC387_Pa03g2927 [Persea americana]
MKASTSVTFKREGHGFRQCAVACVSADCPHLITSGEIPKKNTGRFSTTIFSPCPFRVPHLISAPNRHTGRFYTTILSPSPFRVPHLISAPNRHTGARNTPNCISLKINSCNIPSHISSVSLSCNNTREISGNNAARDISCVEVSCNHTDQISSDNVAGDVSDYCTSGDRAGEISANPGDCSFRCTGKLPGNNATGDVSGYNTSSDCSRDISGNPSYLSVDCSRRQSFLGCPKSDNVAGDATDPSISGDFSGEFRHSDDAGSCVFGRAKSPRKSGAGEFDAE